MRGAGMTGNGGGAAGVEAALASLAGWQPTINAVSRMWPEEAREAAARLDAAGGGPLHGVAVLVKDLFDVAGHETTGCSEAFAGTVAARDADVVARLRQAGAVVVGKANMHELAAGGTNHVSACGPARNPWDPARMTGGSSGGSAAAVAAGCVRLALGTDTGGSIRIPSSFCGVTGLKPTYGRVPLRGAMPLAPSLDCAGPIAESARDAAVAFAVLVGEAPRELPPVDGLRVGLAAGGLFADRVHPDLEAAVAGCAAELRAAGVATTAVALDGLEDAPTVWNHVCWAEFAETYPELDIDRVSAWVRRLYEYGRDLPAEDRAAAAARRDEVAVVFERALRDVDALLLPATPYSAPRFDEEEVAVGDGRTVDVYRGGTSWFTRPVSLSGLPALSLPVGRDARGLPLGAQLVGRAGEESTVLGLGAAFQARTEHHTGLPPPPEPA